MTTPWADPACPRDDRVEALLAEMTLEEKLAQLGSAWPGVEHVSGNVAPMQDVFARHTDFADARKNGLGHLTRPFGTKPVEPAEGARLLAATQRELMAGTRLGIPALAHEECLTGFTTYRATVFPAALAWAAAFDPALVERMARAIGTSMRRVGVHQGLSPVLDVVRDYRWGRVEETLGEDPYLVATTGTAYVRGLESAGIIATLKHFAGYSASKAARNHAPVSMGPREFADVILPPFETALREGGARSVMNSYADVDGMPAGADAGLLTGLLREEWGFEGTVVSDYWSVAFLRTTHHIAATDGEAGARALAAGIDVELPDTLCYGDPLADLVRSGAVPEDLVDRAVRRVLRQKADLGLLDAGYTPDVGLDEPIDLDPPAHRALARQLAERSVVLLDNHDGLLPLAPGTASVALVGPSADDPNAFFGCYSFPNHVLPHHPGHGNGIETPTLLDALARELPTVRIAYEQGCPVKDIDRTGIAAAVEQAERADVCIAVVGDLAGLFGRGTSGEGCDVEDLALPGVQGELVEALLATGTPVVLLVVSGRPYALGAYTGRAAAIVQAFFPGEEGGPALAGVLSGRVTPSGKLPVQVPRTAGGQPGTYLHAPLGGNSRGVSNLDPTPAYPFGHGLSYTEFAYAGLTLGAAEIPTDGEVEISCLVRNTGDLEGTEVVQLYTADPVAQLPRPVTQLTGFARVALAPGQERRVTFRLHTDRLAYTGPAMHRIVEPGEITVMLGASSADIRLTGTLRLTGPVRRAGHDRVLSTPATIG
ncbi:glycoside hydrolase family 3 N-terminal domain-containing protein [Streptomyces acidiscabies]|uniref:Exo-alpha-(1->6)-L-arabinopyranosidase n=1 Tax=Streptomyces acidiscabies TaxID=42234 RepID=A0AAP6BJW0_9ACTN|nr:glycoside hydrolase family 3 N-terminal domain-containing protein [Streptomyces acidiscabies]MBP5941205.1 beta-glucosidase [Streptomyces sp. LBUM 1476]MBZ3912534.1 glycoside hydrolase family 3 C-terminal domain-containing protein [Streptomyces acidiscabies]MDX2966046.1 glycoside hydrolase family 3 N-terminal domain-containing protein [Streptomyces acidiscabies]MDX3025492.1 glycoside hydrolase family 3 N-terminal domain-containing protein [Streptomyces acidiscabies]MDX3796069.1 glycoside hyd